MGPRPSRCCSSTPLPGAKWSGVDVASTMASMSPIGEARGLDGAPAGALRQVHPGLPLAHPVPLPDAGALRDPLVGGVHDRREVVVGDDAIGDGHAGAEDEASSHGLPGWGGGTRGKMLPAGAPIGKSR